VLRSSPLSVWTSKMGLFTAKKPGFPQPVMTCMPDASWGFAAVTSSIPKHTLMRNRVDPSSTNRHAAYHIEVFEPFIVSLLVRSPYSRSARRGMSVRGIVLIVSFTVLEES
jgi:hypothetical protein